MAVSVIPSTKLFKKCTICANNPVHKDFFLVVKKMKLYCINVKNNSIRKVDLPKLYDEDSLVKYSSNGEYFVIIHRNNYIYVFNAKTLAFIRSFYISCSAINTEGSTVSVYDIDKTELNDFVLCGELLICSVDYIEEPYLRHDYSDNVINTGVEVYNILTGELVTNNFNLSVDEFLTTNKNILYYSNNNPSKIYQLTPQLDVTELPYKTENITGPQNKYYFNNTVISFSFVSDLSGYYLQSSVSSFDKVKTTRMNLNFNTSSKYYIYNMTFTPDNKFFVIGMDIHNFTRVLVFNSSVTKYLFYVDIQLSRTFYVIDNYRIVYEFKNSVYVIDTPLTKILHAQKISQENGYYFPEYLWNKILLSF